MRSTGVCFLLAAQCVVAGLVHRTTVEPPTPVFALNARSLTPTVLDPLGFDPKPSSLPFMDAPTPQGQPMPKGNGTLTCQAAYITEDNPAFYMTRNEALIAVNRFCDEIQPGVVFKPVDGTPFQRARNEGPFTYITKLSADWIGGTNPDCPTLDFSLSSATATCKKTLMEDIVDSCNTEQQGRQFWKAGGTYQDDCMVWNIQRYFLPKPN